MSISNLTKIQDRHAISDFFKTSFENCIFLKRLIDTSTVSTDKILMLYRNKVWQLKRAGCMIFFILNLQQLQLMQHNCYIYIKSGA